MSKKSEKVILDRKSYELLLNKVILLEKVLEFIPESSFPIEIYSSKKIKEFLKEDAPKR